MNHFRFLAHLETAPVIARLMKLAPAEWKGEAARGEPDICRSKSILLRHHKDPTRENWLEDLPLADDQKLSEWQSMRNLLKRARDAIKADPVGGKLVDWDSPPGRVMLCSLTPENAVQWHTDNGPYHSRHVRFHIPLLTNPGCALHVQHEVVHMEVGALWLFNNRLQHSATNWGKTLRVHCIFEMPTLIKP